MKDRIMTGGDFSGKRRKHRCSSTEPNLGDPSLSLRGPWDQHSSADLTELTWRGLGYSDFLTDNCQFLGVVYCEQIKGYL